MHKCYACDRSEHFSHVKVCPTKGKTCGKRGHWAACCKIEADGKWKVGKSDGGARGSNNWRSSGVTSGRYFKPRDRQIIQVDYDSGEEPFAFPINSNRERACEDNIIAVKINGIATGMSTDSGAQSTVLSEQQFHNLVRSGLTANLISEERNLRVNGSGCLLVGGQ